MKPYISPHSAFPNIGSLITWKSYQTLHFNFYPSLIKKALPFFLEFSPREHTSSLTQGFNPCKNSISIFTQVNHYSLFPCQELTQVFTFYTSLLTIRPTISLSLCYHLTQFVSNNILVLHLNHDSIISSSLTQGLCYSRSLFVNPYEKEQNQLCLTTLPFLEFALPQALVCLTIVWEDNFTPRFSLPLLLACDQQDPHFPHSRIQLKSLQV